MVPGAGGVDILIRLGLRIYSMLWGLTLTKHNRKWKFQDIQRPNSQSKISYIRPFPTDCEPLWCIKKLKTPDYQAMGQRLVKSICKNLETGTVLWIFWVPSIGKGKWVGLCWSCCSLWLESKAFIRPTLTIWLHAKVRRSWSIYTIDKSIIPRVDCVTHK